MKKLTNDMLIQAYQNAIKLQMDEAFIELLRNEINRRRNLNLNRNIKA
ncbi:sporulation histidine kinase inhibitor Sda [Thalassobacillus hwangdonensis]|uniref:Sporulation histidine kinase inhibitor Sda n=1 Tax=Thalassobacillus hwangdonensis TaxID=546108 RepID=A0ABW3L1H4_9BACI